MITKRSILTASGIASLTIAGAFAADDLLPATPVGNFGLESATPVNLQELKCSDMIALGDYDRGFAMVLLYGYARGEMKDPSLSARDVQVAVVNTTYECVGSPDKSVLDQLKIHILPNEELE